MSDNKPLPVLSLLAAVIVALPAAPNLAIAQEENEEVDCESVCRVFPDRAPPECTCEPQIVGGSSDGATGGEYADPEVRELHGQVQEAWREMTADVENYTVVQTASVITDGGPMQLGPPAVVYFEKEWTDGYPMYRLVSPAELSNREQEARGEPTAGQVGGALGQAIDLLGGAAGAAAGEAAAAAGEAGGGSPLDFDLSPEMNRELTELADLLRNLDEAAEMETREDLADDLYAESKFWERGEVEEHGPCPELIATLMYRSGIDLAPTPGLSVAHCSLIAIRGSDFNQGELASLLGNDVEGYQLEDAHLMIAGIEYGHVKRIGMGADLIAPSGESFRIVRVNSDYATGNTAAFIPRREQLAMSGVGALMGQAAQEIQGIIGDVYVVIHQIRKILINEGAPTREQIAQLIAEVMGESGPGAGFPGS